MPLLLGVSSMWLYAAIRPRWEPGPKTAVVARFFLWFFGSWLDSPLTAKHFGLTDQAVFSIFQRIASNRS